MTMRGKLCAECGGNRLCGVVGSAPSRLFAQQQSAPPGVTVGQNDLGGTVSGASGPEAGVWVIAETTDLPTKFAKIVVTDDQGRYLIPDLPKANYSVWVRGFGLVDSAKTQATPGSMLDLKAAARAEREGGRAILSRRCTGTRSSTSRRRANSRWRRSRARASGSTSSRPAPAIRATASALRACGRSRRSSASSSPRPRPGRGA